MKLKRRSKILVPQVQTSSELWAFLFQVEAPEELALSERVWLSMGYTQDQILQAIRIAALKTRVAYDEKLAYISGVLRNISALDATPTR